MRCFITTFLIIFSTAIFALETVEKSSADIKIKQAQELIKKKEYNKAIPLLRATIATQKNTEAFNHLGYSYRQLNNINQTIKNYQSSLEIDPNQKEVNENLGEAYLINGDLPKAQEQLLVLEKICTSNCIEYQALKNKINYFKKNIYRI